MVSVDDPLFFKILSEKCFELLTNNPSRTNNYDDISNVLTHAMEFFVTKFGKSCIDLLSNFEIEREKFNAVMNEHEFQHLITQMFIERSERYRIGSASEFIKFDSYRHYKERKERTVQRPHYRYDYKFKDLKKLTNVGQLCQTTTKNKPNCFYMESSQLLDVPFEFKKQCICTQSIERKIYIAGVGSPFWSCLSPTVYDLRIPYTIQKFESDTYIYNDCMKNSSRLQKNTQKDIFDKEHIDQLLKRCSIKELEAAKDTSSSNEQISTISGSYSINPPKSMSIDSQSVSLPGKSSSSISEQRIQLDALSAPTDTATTDQESEALPHPYFDDELPSPYLYQVKAKHPYSARSAEELSFKKGQVINVIEVQSSGWHLGELDGIEGYFPSNFVEKI